MPKEIDNNEKNRIQSYICHIVIKMGPHAKKNAKNKVSERIRCPNELKKFRDSLTHAIQMEKIGKGVLDILRSPKKGIKAFALNQPLITSITSIDTWPEKGPHGALVIMIHSCKKFSVKKAKSAIIDFFPESTILQAKFFDLTVNI